MEEEIQTPEPQPESRPVRSRRRLVAGAVLDLVVSLVLMFVLMMPAIGAMLFYGDAEVETWTFAKMPGDDAAIAAWLGQQQWHHSVSVQRKGNLLELRYRRGMLARDPVRMPWAQFGYEGARLSGAGRTSFFDPKSPTFLAAFVLPQAIGMLLAAWLRFYRMRLNREHSLPRFAPLPAGALGLAISVGALMVLSGAAQAGVLKLIFGDKLFDKAPLAGMLKDATGLTLALVAAHAAVFAPFLEELLFRGAMFGRIAAAGHPVLGAVASALLFSVVHMYPPMALHYFLLGLAGAWLYHRTQTLFAPMLAHMSLNGFAILMVLIAKAAGKM